MKDRITAIRTRLGPAALRPRLTMEQLAILLGVSRSYLQKLVQGVRPVTDEVARRLEEVEGLEIEEVRERLQSHHGTIY